jgi:hypothetical protein
MNSTKPGNSENINKPAGIKRRSFLGYLGISAIGIFILSRLPGNLFKSGVNPASSKGKPAIKVSENPFAVKRQAARKNG